MVLEFTPLEFETFHQYKCELEQLDIRIYSVGV